MCCRPTSLIFSHKPKLSDVRELIAAMCWTPASVMFLQFTRLRHVSDVNPSAMWWRPSSLIFLHHPRLISLRDDNPAEMCWRPTSVISAQNSRLRKLSALSLAAMYWTPTSEIRSSQRWRSRAVSDERPLAISWRPSSVMFLQEEMSSVTSAGQTTATISRAASRTEEPLNISVFSCGHLWIVPGEHSVKKSEMSEESQN